MTGVGKRFFLGAAIASVIGAAIWGGLIALVDAAVTALSR